MYYRAKATRMSPVGLRHHGCVVSPTNGFVTFAKTKVRSKLHLSMNKLQDPALLQPKGKK